MKKILSILICVVLGISSAWSQGIITINTSSNPSLGGTTTLQTRTAKKYGISGWQWNSWTNSNQGSACSYRGTLATYQAGLGYSLNLTVSDGYIFEKWQNVPVGELSGSQDYESETIKDIYEKSYSGVTKYVSSNTTYNITAIFQPITVSGYTVNNISISDINTAGQGTVVFNVTNSSDVDVNDFDYNITGEGFSIVNKSYSSGKLTVTVQYTSQTTDNVNSEPKPELSASVTLTSKGGEAGAANKSQTATIKANVSLVPTFAIAPTNYSFFDDYGIIANNESKTKTLTVTTTNNAAAASTYTYVLSDAVSGSTTFSGASNPYTIDASNPLQPVVTFTAPANGYYEDIQCTLTVYCKYTDAQLKQIVSETKQVVLTADAGSTIKINNTQNAAHNFGTTIYGTGASKELPFTATVAYTEAWDPSSIFTHSISGDKITVNVPTTLVPGDYTSELQFIYEGNKVASLTATTKVRLATPVLNAKPYMGQALLTWLPIYGADSYILEQDGVHIATFAAGESSYSHMATNLTSGQSYVFKLTAVYNADNQYNTFVEQTVTPGASSTITINDLEHLGLYTGTEIYVEGHATYGVFPYRPKRAIDLSAAFDANGNALFDELYIFGITTSEKSLSASGQNGHEILVPNALADPSITSAQDARVKTNAKTPCYIYKKINATTYGNLTVVENMNQKTKQIPDITANNQKVYFTGYCPIGSSGYTTGHYGVICFKQNGSNTVDVYIDNFELHARSQTQGGAGIAKVMEGDTIQRELLNKFPDFSFSELLSGKVSLTVREYIESNSGAFAFLATSTSDVYRPVLHLRGENKLRGSSGYVNVTVGALGKEKVAGQYSSPIHLVATKDNHAIKFSVDDVWPKTSKPEETELSGNVRTNGYLDIVSNQGAAPCIELGNANSGVSFNGGRILLKNSYPVSSSYLNTFALSFRGYNQEMDMVKSIMGYTVTIHADVTLFGLGSDQQEGSVEFNDGTIYCKEVELAQFVKYRSYYRTQTSMKCPLNTTINGGSYHCDIWACEGPTTPGASPKNRYGDGLVSDTIPVTGKLAPYEVAQINFPNEYPLYKTEKYPSYPATLGAYYEAKGSSYGAQSMYAFEGEEQPDSVILMIPYQYTEKETLEDIATKNWVMCVPELTLISDDATIKIAGESKAFVDSLPNHQTEYLFYGEYDDYLHYALDKEYYLPDVGLGETNEVELSDAAYQSLQNKGSFKINKAQYIMKPVRGDEWMLFCPPFDVSNVYVIEAYPEAELEKMNLYDAYVTQAQANISYLFFPAYYMFLNDPAQNLQAFEEDWRQKTPKRGKGAIRLQHFTGSNYNANYYLQRSSGVWEWDAENNRFKTDWAYLPEVAEKVTHGDTEYSVVMKKGEIYSMKFPYMYNGYRDQGEGNWDYWTGKFILFEGLGPQTIEGKDKHADVCADKPNNVDAIVRGNSTFSEVVVNNTNAYYCDFLSGGQKFTGPYNTEEFIPPFSGFVLANGQPRQAPSRIKSIDMQTGDVTYDGNGDNGDNQGVTTSTPTIGGNNHMMVYNIEGGVGIVPVVEQQVSIYNAAGQLITSQYLTDEVQIPLPSGIYLIAGAKDQFKAVVK